MPDREPHSFEDFRCSCGACSAFSHESAVVAGIKNALAAEESEIKAALTLLLQTSPKKLTDWDVMFRGVARVPKEVLSNLQTQWSLFPGDMAIGLLEYGITPGAVFDATEGISLLAERLLESERGKPVRVQFQRPSDVNTREQYEQFLAQMRATSGVPENADEPLLAWLGGVAERRPFLFSGFRVISWDCGSFCLQADRTYADAELVLRWSAFERSE